MIVFRIKYPVAIALLAGLTAGCCNSGKNKGMEKYEKGTFGYDLDFLSGKDSLVVLRDKTGDAQIIVSPKYQAKVFASTVGGLTGKSMGFVGYKAFELAEPDAHMNAFGGENRFWLGPEGGRYSVYFAPGAAQVYDNWRTPAPIDTEPWELISSDSVRAVMRKEMTVTNYLGTEFKLTVDRRVELLGAGAIGEALGVEPDPSVKFVAYETQNVITNRNDFEWTEETGLISTWILDMFIPAPGAVTVIPFVEGDEARLGKIVTSDYFGPIPPDRLVVGDGVIFFKTDGAMRGKLGLNPRRATGVAGNFDPGSKRLTITAFDVAKDAKYLNQEWNPDKDPLAGDAMNAYNDGPLEDGGIMGPFLEVESCSPAAFLKPGESQSHTHSVFHFIGDDERLNAITTKLLGVSISEITNAF